MDKPSYKDFCFNGTGTFELASIPTGLGIDESLKKKYVKATRENVERIAELQERLYADRREGLLVMFQAMDTAGKDGTIEHVFSGVNPQGVEVTCFKTPSKEELAHDYMWRAWKALPERGMIGVFNRSYYEDVLVVQVHQMQKGYNMAQRNIGLPSDEFYAQRYEQLSNFEKYLDQNSYRVVKVFLNISQEEQHARFLSRIEEPVKNWKFSAGDLAESALWPQYMEAYQQVISNTSSVAAPWYVIPADQKFVARYLVSELVKDVLEDIDPQFPQLSEEEVAAMQPLREQLLAERNGEEA